MRHHVIAGPFRVVSTDMDDAGHQRIRRNAWELRTSKVECVWLPHAYHMRGLRGEGFLFVPHFCDSPGEWRREALSRGFTVGLLSDLR